MQLIVLAVISLVRVYGKINGNQVGDYGISFACKNRVVVQIDFFTPI